MGDHELWECERRFWLDSRNFFKEHVTPSALLVFPALGILDRAAGAAAAAKAASWTSLAFSGQRSTFASSDTAVLAYQARAEADRSASAYHACCSSTYVRVRRSWMLVAHQQSALATLEQQLTELGALSLFFAVPGR